MGPSISSLTAPVTDAGAPAQILNAIITHLIRADATHAASFLLKLARFQHRDKSVGDAEPAGKAPVPKGPFTVDPGHPSALLIYVPRNLKSRLIDDGTGAYGYSHVTVDCSEIDKPTGKHVMTESTTSDVVHRSFQDHYGSRPFARILLSHLDLDADNFRDCVNEKLGEPYDAKEALTWGAVDDPAKQICSDMAGDCLPSEVRADIARKRLTGRLRRLSVSVHRRFRSKPRVFISPNGFAEYFGSPHGSRLSEPDYLVTPKRPRDTRRAGRKTRGRAAAIILTLSCCVLIAWLLSERSNAKR